MSNKLVICYTDGSAVSQGAKKGHGGYGTYFPNIFDKRRAFSSGFKDTTTGRMEMSALYYAIKTMPIRCSENVTLRVYSDSKFIVDSFNKGWLKNWILNGWQNSTNSLKNVEIWKAIVSKLNERKYMKLEMRHIRSHQVEKEKCPIKKEELMNCPHIYGNMVADRLADYKRHTKLKDYDYLIH